MRPSLARLRRDMVRAAVVSCVVLPGLAVAAERMFSLAMTDGRVAEAERVLRVQKDDTVVVRLSGDRAGQVHLHGYRLSASIVPGTPAEWRFRAHATGRFRLEWHAAGDAAADKHHGPALATLEVLPR